MFRPLALPEPLNGHEKVPLVTPTSETIVFPEINRCLKKKRAKSQSSNLSNELSTLKILPSQSVYSEKMGGKGILCICPTNLPDFLKYWPEMDRGENSIGHLTALILPIKKTFFEYSLQTCPFQSASPILETIPDDKTLILLPLCVFHIHLISPLFILIFILKTLF